MKRRAADPSTDSIDLGLMQDSGLTQTYEAVDGAPRREIEANIILIAHPDGKRLGTRYRLTPGSVLEVGRSTDVEISMPEVLSISRRHARLHHMGPSVTVEDLGSTNGTYVNGQLVKGAQTLKSGHRFQVAGVHFKFLHEQDVEHAYYEAIYDLVTRDGLTDIYNKRKYDEEVPREFSRAQRHERPLSLMILDLDEFKDVNDTHGHLCGDFVLKAVTLAIKDCLRPEQIFARVGGDEFVILSPETDSGSAAVLAEKLRDTIATLAIRYADTSVHVTSSFGIAELSVDMHSPEDLYEAADRALYRSKGEGRNRVAIYAGGGSSSSTHPIAGA
ncbi:MAG: GGDEF domain-containing protein [Acidobacteriota bacterium]